ncbi:MAG: palindromic element RPE4 domain-containing protein [Rickettsia endosymbiont of Pentastiridius leporinus]
MFLDTVVKPRYDKMKMIHAITILWMTYLLEKAF